MILRFSTLIGLLFVLSFNLMSQTFIDDKERAQMIAREAMKELASGKYQRAIDILERCTKLDPYRIDYPYELAFAHKMKGDTTMAINILRNLREHPRCNARVYHLLAISQNEVKQRKKAIANLEKGIERFKTEGILYYQLAKFQTTYIDTQSVVAIYTQGIINDPNFAGNYFEPAIYYLKENNSLGLMLGELFCNLERNTDRTAYISQKLYDSYLSLCLGKIQDLGPPKGKDIVPFHDKIQELTNTFSPIDSLSGIALVNDFNSSLIQSYMTEDFFLKNPNVIIALREELAYFGHLESYYYWLFWQGNEDEFEVWIENNESDFKQFLNWFKFNKIRLNAINKFLKN